jgi:hypothetical protein
MAQMRLRQGGFSNISLGIPSLASIGVHTSEDEDSANIAEYGGSTRHHSLTSKHLAFQKLLQFRDLFSMQEAIRLLSVYQEVVGEYHPVLAIEQLTEQVEAWYFAPDIQSSFSSGLVDKADLLILNLALAIALRAESNCPGSGSADTAKLLYFSCRELYEAEIMPSVPSISQVVITLLVVSVVSISFLPRRSRSSR